MVFVVLKMVIFWKLKISLKMKKILIYLIYSWINQLMRNIWHQNCSISINLIYEGINLCIKVMLLKEDGVLI